MARPRVFISSTYYDLKHIRASLDLFVETLGYDAILSEKGEIAYSPDRPLDESCYHEVENVDIFVLIIGGRYGSEVSSSGDRKLRKDFYDRYESVTKKEFETAIKRDTPVYILIENNVYSEYRTYLKNKKNTSVLYAHVDSVNIFSFIEEILSRPRNNPVHSFEKFEQIEQWLKEQWAGLFRDLLHKRTQQSQIKTLTTEVEELHEVNKTLKKYLEAVMSGMSSDESTKLIAAEKERLNNIHIRKQIEENRWYTHLIELTEIDYDLYIEMQLKSQSYDDFIDKVKDYCTKEVWRKEIIDVLNTYAEARMDFNETRKILGLKQFKKLPQERD